MAQPLRIKLIANPVAGGDARARIARAQAHLAQRGCQVELCLTAARGDARKAAAAARAEGFDRVIAAGGDGTLNEVLNGLVPSSIPLAFLPLGTTNVFALEVGIPFEVEAACDIAVDGEPRPVCLGQAGEERFLLMLSAGFDAEVVYRVSSRLKRWTGKFAYAACACTTLLRHSPPPLELLREDGLVLRGYGVVIGNGRLYGGKFSFTPAASLEAPELDVCLLLRPGRMALLAALLRVALGRPLDPAQALQFKTSGLEVRGAGVHAQFDGDYLSRLPLRVEAVPGELLLVFPPGRGRL